MKTEREARRDAQEFARAQMFYGEGAGIRRKLITATVEAKAHRDPTYARAFHTELSRQDMAEHASKARVERRRKDATETAKKTTKNLLTGKYENLQAGVLIVAAVAYVAHQTGYDKKAWAKGKEYYGRAKAKIKGEPEVVQAPIFNIHNVK